MPYDLHYEVVANERHSIRVAVWRDTPEGDWQYAVAIDGQHRDNGDLSDATVADMLREQDPHAEELVR